MTNNNFHQEFNRAQDYLNQGNIKAAEDIASALLTKQSKSPELYNLLGIIYLTSGRQDKSILFFKKALKIKPFYPLANSLIGCALAAINKNKDALVYLHRAIIQDPMIIESYINSANIYIINKNFGKAKEVLTAGLKIDPNNIQVYEMLGNLYITNNQFNEAISSLLKGISINPNIATIHNNLAVAYEKKQCFEEAKIHYQRSILINNKIAATYVSLGKLHYKLQEAQEAKAVFIECMDLCDKYLYLEVIQYLAIINSELNNPNEAIGFFEDFLTLIDDEPLFFKMLWNLCEITGGRINPKIMQKADELYADEKLNDECKAYYNFVMGAMNEVNKENIQYIKKANNYLNKFQAYSFQSDFLISESSKAATSSLTCVKHSITNKDKFCPIFIVGMPRSGTTLMEQIISSHPNVYGAGEVYMISDCATKILDEIATDNQTILIDKLILMREKYVSHISSISKKLPVHVDKYPLNFLYINFILTLFPEAKIINMTREKGSIALSLYERYIGKRCGFSSSIDDIFSFYNLYVHMMEHWEALYPGKIYTADYEALTDKPDVLIPEIIDFCGLPWNRACLEPHLNKKMVSTPSKLQVRRKIYSGSSSRWHDFIPHIDGLEKFLN